MTHLPLNGFLSLLIFTIINAIDRQIFNSTLTASLSEALMTILKHTSSERGRTAVPPITNSSGISPFPFRISVRVADVEVG